MASDTVGIRMAVGAVCFVGGFFFWPLFIPAALIATTLTATPEERHEAQRPKPKAAPIERAGIKAEDPDWKTRFLEACESPAESSFLTAMISSFSLQPHLGVLRAPGLTLNMQVEMGAYRLDFLANGWLVIEIDGAAWHSSPEAVFRDRKRDRYFRDYDYTVLRISAKTVFNTPQEAVRMVRAALAEGQKVPTQKVTPQKPVSVLGAVGGIVRGVGDFAEGASAYVDRASAIQQAMAKPQSIYGAEKQAIQIAMKSVESSIKVKEFRAQSDQHRELFDKSMRDLEKLLTDRQDSRDPGEELRQLMRERITPIQAPQPHPKEETDEAIKSHFASMMEERAAFFAEIKGKLTADEARSAMVKAELLKMGCLSCWMAVAPRTSKVRLTLSDLLQMAPQANLPQVPTSSSAVKPNPFSAQPSSPSAGGDSREM